MSGSKEFHGIGANQGGVAVVRNVTVKDNQQVGVRAVGQGSKVEVEGGTVSGSKEFDGISAEQGGVAVVKGVQISNCARYGLCRVDGSSRVEDNGGIVIRNCRRGDRCNC